MIHCTLPVLVRSLCVVTAVHGLARAARGRGGAPAAARAVCVNSKTCVEPSPGAEERSRGSSKFGAAGRLPRPRALTVLRCESVGGCSPVRAQCSGGVVCYHPGTCRRTVCPSLVTSHAMSCFRRRVEVRVLLHIYIFGCGCGGIIAPGGYCSAEAAATAVRGTGTHGRGVVGVGCGDRSGGDGGAASVPQPACRRSRRRTKCTR